MKNIFLLVGLMVFLGLAIGLIIVGATGQSQAKMPDAQCNDFASNKDDLVMKQADFKDALISYYYIQDQCTGEVFECRPGSCPNPTDVLYSAETYPTHYSRTYVSGSGTIYGRIWEAGWRGGQSWEYYICADGRSRVTHTGSGWWGGNRQTKCDTL